MAVNKIAINYVLYQNANLESPAYGKVYAKPFEGKTLSEKGMVKHLLEHGCPYGEGTVKGVIDHLKSCLLELIAQGTPVKIDGLGKFYITFENKKGGAASFEEYNVNQHLLGVHIRFLPESAMDEDITSRTFRESVALYCLGKISGSKADKTYVIEALGNHSDDDGEGGDDSNP